MKQIGRPSKYNINDLNEKFGKDICEEYQKGEHASVLAKKYLNNEKDYRFIFQLLELNDIHKRTMSENKILRDLYHRNEMGYAGRVYEVNHDYFKTWSHNMAYILGLLATDGNVNGSSLRLCLQANDREVLEAIKNEMNFTGVIRDKEVHLKGYDKTYKNCVLLVKSQTIIDDLKNLGIVENKSLILQSFENIVPQEYQMDFIRGVIDGDGSIGKCGGKSNRDSIQIRVRIISASYTFIEGLRNIIETNGLKSVNITSKNTSKHTIYEICYSTRDAIELYHKLYTGDYLRLDRKFQKFTELINQRIKYEDEALLAKKHLKLQEYNNSKSPQTLLLEG